MADRLRVLVVGCGTQGSSHARAAQKLAGFEIAGVVDKAPANRERLAAELGGVPAFEEYPAALSELRPEVVSIATWPDTHADFAIQALEAGAHVFVEKPLATTVERAEQVIAAARAAERKLYVGYILRSHPAWKKFIEIARTLGKPLVMRMNLNQQSSGAAWQVHKNLMGAMSPIVDCGVHYVDVMCQMSASRPVRVQAVGARLSDEIDAQMYNYGNLQVVFEDGSVGWYEAGWGPMMSEVAFFVKDVIGPRGCVSIADAGAGGEGSSADIEAHTKTNRLRLHHAELDAGGDFARTDEMISTADEPDHQGLCDLQQETFLRAIEENHDLSEHQAAVVDSLRIVLAADESVRTGRAVEL